MVVYRIVFIVVVLASHVLISYGPDTRNLFVITTASSQSSTWLRSTPIASRHHDS
jgi:hypothetical protein